MTASVTPRHRELLTMASVQSQLPVVFGNGNQITEFQWHCANCSCLLSDRNVRGVVSKDLPQVAIVDAVGYCKDCMGLTQINYRIYDDLRMTGIRNGRWVTWYSEITLLSRLKHALSQVMRFLNHI